MSQYRFLVLLGLLGFASPGFTQPKYPFEDTSLPMEKRIDNVLSLLTLDEKIAGLGNKGVVSTAWHSGSRAR